MIGLTGKTGPARAAGSAAMGLAGETGAAAAGSGRSKPKG